MNKAPRGYKKNPFFLVLFLLLAKLVLLRYFIFEEIAWDRLAADAIALLALLCIVELIVPAKWKGPGYWLFNLLISCALFASTLYFQYFNTVPTYTTLYELRQVIKIKSSVKSTVRPLDYVFFVDVAVFAAFWCVYRVRGKRTEGRIPLWRTGAMLAALLCLVVSGRYVQLGQPIANELKQAEYLGFLNYQASVVWKGKVEKLYAKPADPLSVTERVERLKASYPYKNTPAQKPDYFGSQKGKNVIFVQLEAFQNFPVQLKLGDTEVTPVINKLAKESFYFPRVFQQIGQGNTSDAEFISNTSIYPTGEIAMSTGFGDRTLPGLPRALQSMGYAANTFHVNDVTFWDRLKLYPGLNFDHYYDRNYYENDHFNEFGASDEELYRVGVEKMAELNSQNQPFYSQFVTASSHFPFKIPEDRKKITLPEHLQGTQLGDYLTAVNYTDYALGTLIDRLKEQGLWENTVLVLYGDHFGLQPQDNDPKRVEQAIGIPYHPYISRFNIPLLIHAPGMTQGKTVNQVGGQLDILPTVANLLGIPLNEHGVIAFGQDLLNIDRNVLGIRSYLPTGSFIDNDILFEPGKGFEDGTATSLTTFRQVTDIIPYKKDYDYIMNLMTLSDEYVKNLPKRKTNPPHS